MLAVLASISLLCRCVGGDFGNGVADAGFDCCDAGIDCRAVGIVCFDAGADV